MYEQKVEAVIISREEREHQKQQRANSDGWLWITSMIVGLLCATGVIGPY